MDADNKKTCRVCGYKFNQFYPWGEEGETPSFSYCPCCFTEFGYDDTNREIIYSRRADWIAKGYLWYEPNKKPKNWNPQEQMKNIPKEYL